ncbi:unnamed protein product [Malus baccata var. baccata]
MAKIIAILMILLVAGSAMGDGDDRPKVPYCPIVLDNLTPCLPYVLENEAKPAKVCCNGVLDLSHSAGNKEGRQNICDCIKAEAILMNMPLDNFSKISSLPKACGLLINLPPISNNTDCSTGTVPSCPDIMNQLTPCISHLLQGWQSRLRLAVTVCNTSPSTQTAGKIGGLYVAASKGLKIEEGEFGDV